MKIAMPLAAAFSLFFLSLSSPAQTFVPATGASRLRAACLSRQGRRRCRSAIRALSKHRPELLWL